MSTTGDETAQPPPKRPRHDVVRAEPKPAAARVEFNPADCNLDFEVGGGGLRGHALHGGVSAYCWSGARATVGVRGGGRYCFGCRVLAEEPVQMDDTDADQRHLCRIGFSRGDDSVSVLGESSRSFGFEGTGKLFHKGSFFEYGDKYGVGDTIVCAVDLDSKPRASIGFSKNCNWLGIAQCFDATQTGFGLLDAPVRPMQWESAIFPHVLLKNVVVEMQFSREDGLEPVEGYEPWSSACGNGNGVLGPAFAEEEETELILMVGLPASGKSTWAEKWAKDHPEKRFVLLGTDLALKQMQLMRLFGKHNYYARLDCWMNRAAAVLNSFLHIAPKIPHNYIIDRLHLSKIERIRTLSPFIKYRKTAVVVFPSMKNLKQRLGKRYWETWKEVPDEVVNQLAANFVLPLPKDAPGSLEAFDEINFVELSRDNAQRVLDFFRPPSAKHGNKVSSTSSGLGSGWQSTTWGTAASSNAPEKQIIQHVSAKVSSTSSASGSGWQSTRWGTAASSNAPEKQIIQHISAKIERESSDQQSSSNALEKVIPAKDEPVDDDFVLFRKFDLYAEYESMDIEYERINELSVQVGTTRAEIRAAWSNFEARLDVCREIQREIRAARGSAPSIPDRFLR